MTVTRITHLTDLHLPVPVSPKLGELLSKRALGFLSWTRNRRFRHLQEVLDVAAADVADQACDADVITGDIVNISTPAEFAAAAEWLGRRFDPGKTLFCPGNHDAYVDIPWRDGLGRLSPYMSGERLGDRPDGPAGAIEDFPYFRVFGEVAVIMANSSPPTAPGLATGKLGDRQLGLIREMLTHARVRGLTRVLALHHPITSTLTSRRKALNDNEALRAMIAETGADLILHGHTHFPSLEWIKTPSGRCPVVGGGSASHPRERGRYKPARYNIFTITADRSGPQRIDMDVREYCGDNGAMRTVDSISLLDSQRTDQNVAKT